MSRARPKTLLTGPQVGVDFPGDPKILLTDAGVALPGSEND